MAHRRRRTRRLAGAALVLAAALAAAGCTSNAAATGTGTGPSGTGPSAMTTAQASQVFGGYVTLAGRAAAGDDAPLALSRVTGVQQETLGSEFRAAKAGDGVLARYRYGTPTFYLPRPAGYPRWFVASAERTLVSRQGSQRAPDAPGAPGAPDAPGGIAGVRLAASGRVLMLFEQASASSPWLLASTSQLPAGQAVPPLATDSGGYVATVPLSSGAQLARPDTAGALQAAVVDDGPASPAARVVAAGDLTTGIYQAARSSVSGLAAPPGDTYLWELQGTHYPTFALRTADGGALVFYSMYLNSTVEVPAALSKGVVRPGPPIAVPGYLRYLLPPGTAAPREQLIAQQLLSFAAVDPPAGAAGGAGKIQVIAMGGGWIYASAS